MKFTTSKILDVMHHDVTIDSITTHSPTLLVRLNVEPFEQWSHGPNFITYKQQSAESNVRNSGTNATVFNFSKQRNPEQ